MPYTGEIRAFAGTYAPVGWQLCDGSLLQISDYSDLFELLGTTYGGDGQTTFAVPDFRGRVAVQTGQLAGGSSYPLGAKGGTETVAITTDTMSAHTHLLKVDTVAGTTSYGSGNFLAVVQDSANPGSSVLAYLPYCGPIVTTAVPLKEGTISYTGRGYDHENRQPYMGITYIIATTGDFPTFQSSTDKL